MKSIIITFLVIAITTTSAQYLFQQQQPIAYALQPQSSTIHLQQQQLQPQQQISLAHPAVVENSINESHLPAELIRSDTFYRNPKTANALAKDSWLTDKEMPVFEREAEKIPREQVVKIFKNAGFIHRRR